MHVKKQETAGMWNLFKTHIYKQIMMARTDLMYIYI